MKKTLAILISGFFFWFSSGFCSSLHNSTVTVTWLGHACFLIKGTRVLRPSPILFHEKAQSKVHFTQEAYSILLDPYGAELGYPVHQIKADAVFISHEHFDHNNASMVPCADVYRGLKDKAHAWNVFHLQLAPGISLSSIGTTFHDRVQGKKRGLNSIAVLDFFGVRIVHLGDLGHLLTPAQVKAIAPVDVLMIPVGGVYTIDGKQAKDVVEELNPKMVLPMHYAFPKYNKVLHLNPVEDFLKVAPWPVKTLSASELMVSKGALPTKTTVYLLQPLNSAPVCKF